MTKAIILCCALFEIKDGPHAVIAKWDWTDWVGLIGFILVMSFVVTVAVALARSIHPLKILDRIGTTLSAVMGRRSGSSPKPKRDRTSN